MSEEIVKAAPETSIVLNEADHFDLMQRQSALFASSQIVPKAYQNNLPNCFIAVRQFGRCPRTQRGGRGRGGEQC